ncbi:aldo/keto reductase [Jiangella endophytica]|uniref:aldo/keto reductase n=1 Tax=Jiangella endophytica TaxID=1623398 RepID=UPI000E34529D|nr:aldo/keto reductase [Jiangella endophytica]
MRYRLLGPTGLRVSELALGTMTFGDDWGWGAPAGTCRKILDTYAAAGGNLVDTANNYTDGSSESILGELLTGRRDEFVLATKYNSLTRPGDPNAAGNHRKNLVQSVEASLRRLRTDRIDVLWVHARDVFTPVPEVMRALDDLVRAGKVLYVGASDWPAWEVAQGVTLAELRGWSPFAGVQVRYNLLERTVEREFVPMAESLGLSVLAWAPMAAGRLTGKYLDGGSGRLDTHDWDNRDDHNADAVVRAVVEIARDGGWTPARVAIAWLLSRPGDVVPIVGATSEAQLTDSLGAPGVRLPEEALARLDELSRVPRGFPHDFLDSPGIREIVYGDRWRQLDDRRGTGRHLLS